MSMRGLVARLLAAGVLLVAACSPTTAPGAEGTAASDSPPIRFDWRPVTLPVPAGPAGRLALRDAVACAGRWYVVGAVASPGDSTRPAVWASADAQSWRPVPIAAITPYGRENVLSAAGCRAGRLAAIGAKHGGAHGNARVSTWRLRPDGVLTEVPAPYTHYGGQDAVNVARITGGPRGWLIVGNRVGGAAVWVAADATAFRLIEGVPELASDSAASTWANDSVGTAAGWTVVGGVTTPGRPDRDPALWTSPDGSRWRRHILTGTSSFEELQRVTDLGGSLLALGPAGDAFGAWRSQGGQDGVVWRLAARFGTVRGPGVAEVRNVVTAKGQVLAAVGDGAAFSIWVSTDGGGSWRPSPPPVNVPAGADRALAVAAGDARLLLITDDGIAGRVWAADTQR